MVIARCRVRWRRHSAAALSLVGIQTDSCCVCAVPPPDQRRASHFTPSSSAHLSQLGSRIDVVRMRCTLSHTAEIINPCRAV